MFISMKAASAAAFFTIFSSLLPTAFAWGAAGHEIVATIAQIYMDPIAVVEVCNILYPGSNFTMKSPYPPCHISRIATWADQVRRQPKYRYTGPLHYIGAVDDHPSDSCAFPGQKGWAGHRDVNVLGGIRNMSEIVSDYTIGLETPEMAEEAMKFLVHFLGDMHMPLHLTGRERGGNSARVTFEGRVTNLHSLWDGYLIAQALRTIPRNYTRPLSPGSVDVDIESHLRDTIYDPYVRRLIYEGFGNMRTPGRFSDYLGWLDCPDVPDSTLWEDMQVYFGFRRYKEETRWDDDLLCPYAWAKELHKMNCEFPVWPRELDQPPYKHSAYAGSNADSVHDHEDGDVELSRSYADVAAAAGGPRPHPDLLELDTPEYGGRIRSEWLVEHLLAKAGIRLAGYLNGLFLDTEDMLLAWTTGTRPVIVGL